MAVHSQNLRADPRASLFVAQPEIDGDPLGAARVTLMGKVALAGPEARTPYLKRYENAQQWIDFEDFSILRLEISDIYFIGGFGVMGWIRPDLYQCAHPDPLVAAASSILAAVNAGHAPALCVLARIHAGLEADEARVIAIDRLGFELRVRNGHRAQATRIPFPVPVETAETCHRVLAEMIAGATPC